MCVCVCVRARASACVCACVYLPSATHALGKRVHSAGHHLDLLALDQRHTSHAFALDQRHTSHAPLDSQRLPHSFPHRMSGRFAHKMCRHRVRALCERARTLLQAHHSNHCCKRITCITTARHDLNRKKREDGDRILRTPPRILRKPQRIQPPTPPLLLSQDSVAAARREGFL